jgi:hypothetical protein
MVVAEEPAGPTHPGMHLVANQQRAALARQLLGGDQEALRWHVHAFALDWLDQQRWTSPRRSSLASASRSPKGMAVSGSSGPNPRRNSAAPLTDSEPAVSPWKP